METEPTDIIEQSQELRRLLQLTVGALGDERRALTEQIAVLTRRASALDEEIAALAAATTGHVSLATGSPKAGRRGTAASLICELLGAFENGLLSADIIAHVVREKPGLKESTVQVTIGVLARQGILTSERVGRISRYKLASR